MLSNAKCGTALEITALDNSHLFSRPPARPPDGQPFVKEVSEHELSDEPLQ